MSRVDHLVAYAKNYREIHIDSRNRNSGSIDDFTINIPVPLNIRTAFLIEAEIPFSWYSINSTNNKLDFTETGQALATATITPGNYSPDTFGPILKAALTAVTPTPATYTVSYDTNTNKFTISSTVNYAFNFATGPNTTSSIGKALGFDVTADTSTAASHTSDNVVNLAGELYVLVKSSNLVKPKRDGVFVANGTNDEQVLAKIPIEVLPNNIMFYKANRENPVIVNVGSNISTISLKLTFLNNVNIDMNAIDWNCIIGCYTG